MGDDVLYNAIGLATLLSKYNISIIRKEDGRLLLVQFTSETTYIPLGEAVDSYDELWKLACEVAVQVHFTIKEKEKGE
tara:strand:- start:56 stop:289 length:234 start_codon:yes stop_codon:yes gene_type:complete